MYLGQGYKPISIKSLLKVNNQSNKKGATYAPVPSAEEFASEIGLTALENVLQVKNFDAPPIRPVKWGTLLFAKSRLKKTGSLFIKKEKRPGCLVSF